MTDIPDFLRIPVEDRIAAWQLYDECGYGAPVAVSPRGATGPIGPRPGEPSYTTLRLGYALDDDDIEGLRAFRMAERVRKERTSALAEERKLKADDASIVEAVRLHHAKKQRKRGKRRAHIADV